MKIAVGQKIIDLIRGKKKVNKQFVLPKPFENDEYKALSVNYDNFFDMQRLRDIPFRKDGYKLEDLSRVSFELSNSCCYSYMHKKCPCSMYKEKHILSSDIVYSAIDELSTIDYSGVIAFHRYNEPLIDPRLFQFIEYVNKKIPKAKILILTNGFYLTQVILDELSKYHLWCIAVSSYSLKEHERLSGLKTHVPYYVFFSVLDDRKSIYERGVLNCTLPCFNPLNDFNILSTGEVGLCCLDYENRFTFGSLGEGRTIASVLSSEAYTTVCNELREGKRRLLICKNCDWAR